MIKKIMNDPAQVVPELLEGLLRASGGKIVQVGPVGAIAKATIPDGKVALLIGGGSGHEPLFHGFVGDGLADGAACGNIFAAPTPDVILAVTRALDRGKGVLYVYANYAGDVMNFDIAAELAAEEGIRVRTVLIRDDVASAPPDRQAAPPRYRGRRVRREDRGCGGLDSGGSRRRGPRHREGTRCDAVDRGRRRRRIHPGDGRTDVRPAG